MAREAEYMPFSAATHGPHPELVEGCSSWRGSQCQQRFHRLQPSSQPRRLALPVGQAEASFDKLRTREGGGIRRRESFIPRTRPQAGPNSQRRPTNGMTLA